MVRYILKFLFLSFCFGQNLLNETFDNVTSFPYNGWEFIPDPSQYPPNTGEWRISTWSTSFNTTPPAPTYYWGPAQSGSYDHPYSGHYMYSPIINVSDITNVIVSFKMAFDGFPSPEGHYNGMNIEYNSDGTNWIRALNYEISSASGDQVDIFPRTESFYATMGQTLQIRWETYGTNSYYIDNWHIDDISVEVSEIYYEGPIWHVSNEGSDETGDGSEDNPYATIQTGIDAASDGDTVLVHNGQYIENIIFDNSQTGKNIVLGSLFLIDQDTSHISATILDGGNSSRVLDIKRADTTTHITGFTITNGNGGGWGGGGIRCGLATPASPYLSNLVIKENYGYTGGGILIDYESNPGLKNITFDANVGVLSGGAISIRGNCNVILDNIVIKSNQTEESNYIYGGGAGIKIDNNSYVTLRNSLIFNNNSQPNPGLAGVPGAALNIKDNSVVAIDYSTIFGNTTNPNDQSFADQEIYLGSNSELSISNTIIWDDAVHSSVSSVWVANNCNLSQSYIQSGENNINLDPLFCNRELFDFTLAENSPCIESGENGSNIGALGVGCGAIYFNPEIEDIDNQQIEEDGSLSLMVNAVSPINISMTYHAESDTSDVVLSFDNSTLIATPSPNWNGTTHILVMVTDENELSDTTDFTLTVTAVNDPPEVFSVIYPTESDTFSTHMDSDTLIAFNWEESSDVDSYVTYTLTIELEFFGNTYTDVHENITDTTINISSNSLDPLLDVTSQDEATFTYYVHSSDDEYMVSSDIGEYILSRAVLGINNGLSLPETFTLHQNYPNPFNPVTKLRYYLPQDSHVRVTVYDMLGNVINNLVNDNQNSGYKSVQWDANNNQGQQVSSGVYLYSIETGDFRQTKKMILLK